MSLSTAKKPRVLLIPDGFGQQFSGHLTAVCAAQVMRGMGFEVAVFDEARSDHSAFPEFRFYDRIAFSTRAMLSNSRAVRAQYEGVLDAFEATHVFLIGAAVNKFPVYFDAAFERGIRVNFLWLVNDFYCQKNWAVRGGAVCHECNAANYLPSLRHDCVNDTTSSAGPTARRQKQLQGMWLRWLQRPRQLKAHKAIGSCDDQLAMYRTFGHREEQLVKCPFFYDRRRLDVVRPMVKKGNYFIFLGQHSETKGWDYISRIIDRCPGVPFLVPFMKIDNEPLGHFDLRRHVESGQLTVVSGTGWGTGTERLLAESLGVINPSVWATTTESVLMESLGLGKPTVVFSQGIHREVFSDGENGMMVELGNVDGFAERVLRIHRMGEAEYSSMSKMAVELFDFLCSDVRYEVALREAFC